MSSNNLPYRLLETIKLQDGEFLNFKLHWNRILHSTEILYGKKPDFTPEDIRCSIPPGLRGIFKFRLIYTHKIEHFEYVPYVMAIPWRWKLVTADNFDYHLKYENRRFINHLCKQYEKEADDVIFVQHGLITDASYANLVFYDGSTWWTPSSPLLPGTQRAFLLERGIIRERLISVSDLKYFTHFKLINALLGFDFPEVKMRWII